MTQYTTYAQFISCTDLVDFQQGSSTYHKMKLSWSLLANNIYQYDRIELYRYIGQYMECVNPDDITESESQLIYAAKQNVGTDGVPNGSSIIETYFPAVTQITVNTNIVSLNSFTDDFASLNPNGTELDVFHSLNGIVTNLNVANDIGFTRRVVYYLLKTYIKGIADSAPYLLAPDYGQRNFTNHSSKSQVKHNYLHYEGDEMWCSKEKEAGNDPGLSRTAVDVSRMHKDPTQSGPKGSGGYAWVSDRSTGKIFQHNLRDGFRVNTWQTPITSSMRGFGIGILPNTGDCVTVPGNRSGPSNLLSAFRCNINNGTITTLMELTATKTIGYGVIPLQGYPNKMMFTEYGTQGPPAVITIPNKNIATIVYPSTASETLTAGGYAAGSCPNGKGIQKGLGKEVSGPGWDYVILIDPIDANWFKYKLSKTSSDSSNTTISANGTRIATDQYNLYPNTIINSSNTDLSAAKNFFTIYAGNEFGVYIPSSAVDTSNCVINWAVKWGSAAKKAIYDTAGYDGENNHWSLSATGKTKLYRTAGERVDGDGFNMIYPYGGESRYPAITLDQWPLSITNTKEIEWFLTRNHGVSTLNPASFNASTQPNTQIELDPSTLDNTVSANWLSAGQLYDGSPAKTQTAYQAWHDCVEKKMLRHLYTGSYKTADYFEVYNPQGILDGSTRKWGIRMDVTEERQHYNNYITTGGWGAKNHDKFYEMFSTSSYWIPIIRKKIRAWSVAFADPVLSYPTKSDSVRSSLVNGNLQGMKVHPHYKFANSATGTNGKYYKNPNLTAAQQTAIIKYIANLKYIDLHNLTLKNLYMYSNFTGAGLQEEAQSSPLNTDKIYPAPTTPSITLFTSGYQTGFEDSPSACYPWKNTVPVSMSAYYNEISGYDDFNVSYYASANMGSYLLTSFRLSTDDFYPQYFTDTDNIDVIVTTKNLAYLSSNIYESVEKFEYTYHSPTINGLYYLPSGKDGVYQYPHNFKVSGKFNATTDINVTNLYNYVSTDSVGRGLGESITISDTANVAVLERWPEPRFYLDSYDNETIRRGMFCQTTWGDDSQYNKDAFIYNESNSTDAKRYDITYGVDPISAKLMDRSIARTWPISSWQVTITSDNFRLGSLSSVSFQINSNSDLYCNQDKQNEFVLISSMPFRYGNYTITMNVQASTTATSSDRPFIQYVNIAEFEPFANFWAVSAFTVPSNFNASSASITGQIANITTIPNGKITADDVEYYFVSGYAPNLTVYFQDSSEAHTFPISSYQWNFGDPFNEGPMDITSKDSNYYLISDVGVTGGNFASGCWSTDMQQHTAVHTYIMPGTYDVTLTVKASCTDTANICARYTNAIEEKRAFYVYVEEIMPICNDSVQGSLVSSSGFTNVSGGVSGNSPLTAYFMASSIIAGSFPIGRIDWDFGDGTIEKITRRPLTLTTTQGLSVINISAYDYDVYDPRNMVIPHIYTNKTNANQTFDINISAYACNTNSMIHCSAFSLVSPVVPEPELLITDTKKLIGSRFDDNGNLIYLVEGQTNMTTYTIAMSGELT